MDQRILCTLAAAPVMRTWSMAPKCCYTVACKRVPKQVWMIQTFLWKNFCSTVACNRVIYKWTKKIYVCVLCHLWCGRDLLPRQILLHCGAQKTHNTRVNMSHIWMSHVTHINESCRTYEWVMSHDTRINEPKIHGTRVDKLGVTRVNGLCYTCQCVMPHMWMVNIQKSHVYTQKSRMYTQRAMYTLKRAMYTLKRAVYTLKRAMFTLKRTMYTLKRSAYLTCQGWVMLHM